MMERELVEGWPRGRSFEIMMHLDSEAEVRSLEMMMGVNPVEEGTRSSRSSDKGGCKGP